MKSSKNLDHAVAALNVLTDSPLVPHDGKVWCIGNFHISQQTTGYCLMRVVNEAGGTTDWLGTGHIHAARLKALICVFIDGINFGRENKKKKLIQMDPLEKIVRTWASMKGLTYESHRLIGDSDLEVLTTEQPQRHLGFIGNGGYMQVPNEFIEYLQANTPFEQLDVKPLYEANKLARELNAI